jgi:hypothetical protein
MPLVYLVTAGAVLASYAANKYAFLRIFANPPMLNEGLSDIFGNFLALLVLCSNCLQVQLFGGFDPTSAAYERGLWTYPLISIVVLAIYVLIPLPCCRPKILDNASDAKSVTFSAEEKLGYLQKCVAPRRRDALALPPSTQHAPVVHGLLTRSPLSVRGALLPCHQLQVPDHRQDPVVRAGGGARGEPAGQGAAR